MRLAASTEHYLVNILILQARHGEVRSIDIASSMGFSKPSVSRAVHLLKDNGYLLMDENSFITLSPLGLKEAKKVYEKNLFLREFLIHLGVSEEVASVDSCRMEHVISEETFAKITEEYPEIFKRAKQIGYDDDFILNFHKENHRKYH